MLGLNKRYTLLISFSTSLREFKSKLKIYVTVRGDTRQYRRNRKLFIAILLSINYLSTMPFFRHLFTTTKKRKEKRQQAIDRF